MFSLHSFLFLSASLTLLVSRPGGAEAQPVAAAGDVRLPPYIESAQEALTIYRPGGQPLNWTCVASGAPDPTYTWMRNGFPVAYTGRSEFVNLTETINININVNHAECAGRLACAIVTVSRVFSTC